MIDAVCKSFADDAVSYDQMQRSIKSIVNTQYFSDLIIRLLSDGIFCRFYKICKRSLVMNPAVDNFEIIPSFSRYRSLIDMDDPVIID